MTDDLSANGSLEELKRDLKYALPSSDVLNEVSYCAVEYNGLMIVLKDRHHDSYSMQGAVNRDVIYYNDSHALPHDFKELKNKNVIINLSLLHQRGKEAIYAFVKGEY